MNGGWKQLDIRKAFAIQKRQNLLEAFPDDFLKQEIFSFLSINDMTNLGLTSRAMFGKISSSRQYPCVVWVERLPTKMAYSGRNDEGLTTLFQVQSFRFVIRTVFERTLRAKVSLLNEAWDEQGNMRDGFQCRSLDRFPSTTYPCLSLSEKLDNGVWRDFFEAAYFLSRGNVEQRVILLDDREVNEFGWFIPYMNVFVSLSVLQEANLYLSMTCVLLCTQCIAAYPDQTAYPSAEFFMRQLPDWLHDYFPRDFDWHKEYADRTTKIEFSYRPARTIEEWRAYVPEDSVATYSLDELPWYREGYSWFSETESDEEDEN